MTSLQAKKIDELKSGFAGKVVLPGDATYDETRKIWNAMIDKRPAVIARCSNTADVVRGVKFARDNGLLLAVRGGRHNIAGSALCDGGIVIDLSLMKAAKVDPNKSGSRSKGCDPRRSRRGNSGPRTRHSARDQLHDGGRRPDARRRLRLAQPKVGNDGR